MAPGARPRCRATPPHARHPRRRATRAAHARKSRHPAGRGRP
ncbi:hypothetical protein PAI11_21100 [Patulibacter medicamentivorans]|uniref:Uncharacterized protein n=1 Tax=Patulibacter medicamentivorans TaxID=1097667 RepID=H0E5L5_9ACTN|nr:hypothetical protein PAI11_21100 [Patulibacter medicamentivorans]